MWVIYEQKNNTYTADVFVFVFSREHTMLSFCEYYLLNFSQKKYA